VIAIPNLSVRNQLTVYEEQQAAIRAEAEAARIRDSKDWTYRCPTCGHTFQADGVTASCPKGPHEGHPGRWPIYYN
jgi:rubrerythrin